AYAGLADLHFFFSSRRRHTRSYGDWSSDVCSSDLPAACWWRTSRLGTPRGTPPPTRSRCAGTAGTPATPPARSRRAPLREQVARSEERRVGKECRARVGACQAKARADESQS